MDSAAGLGSGTYLVEVAVSSELAGGSRLIKLSVLFWAPLNLCFVLAVSDSAFYY